MGAQPHDLEPGYPLARRFAGASLLIGEWRCQGATSRISGVELARHFELSVQRLGSHARQTGRERTVADAAHALVQHAGDRYHLEHPLGEPQRSVVLLLAPALVEELTRRRPLRSRSVPLSPRAALALHDLGRALASPACPLAVEDSAHGFLDAVADAGPRRAPESAATHRVLVEELQHQLARRYRSKITLGELARAAGVSPFHASRVFHRVLGVSMRRYLVRLRLFAALHDLDERRGDWSRLALEVGFASHSHFTDTFVRELGVAPRALGRRARVPRGG